MFSGGALGRMTIFALTIIPYISASIIMTLMRSLSAQIAQLSKEGESGRKTINQYTRYLTVLLATVQAWGFAVALESTTGASGSLVLNPGLFFKITTVVTLVGGVMLLLWLGEQITERGLGNGVSLIIFSGIVAEVPRAFAQILEQGRTGALSPLLIIIVFFVIVLTIALSCLLRGHKEKLLYNIQKDRLEIKYFLVMLRIYP